MKAVIPSCRKKPIDPGESRANCIDRGSYLLVLYNETEFSKKIGALGERQFRKGYYVYVGSALNGLEGRIKRHMRKEKKIHWHLDYIYPSCMKMANIFRIRGNVPIEESLAKQMQTISDDAIPGFGSSDSSSPSHLFYFRENPARRSDFLKVVHDSTRKV